MSYLFVDDDGASINYDSNYMVVKNKDGMVRKLPVETVDAIYLFSSVQITSQCIVQCLTRGINISYYSKGGTYFGRLQSTNHINVSRQRAQARLENSEFSLAIAKNIIKGKIHNQEVVLQRYVRSRNIDVGEEVTAMRQSFRKIDGCDMISEIMGYEGRAAKCYFAGLAKLVEPEFAFKGRSKQPPRDEFNSMLSLGYSILMNEIYSKLENKGLNPYFGFIHSDREKHPTLVSDMMEEWRATIVDSMVMSMVNGHEILKEDFYHDLDMPGYYLSKSGMKKFLKKFDTKMRTETKYLPYADYPVSFRRAIDLQIGQLAKAIDEEDAGIYNPLWLR